jgi:deazaflavin-dependent oxidoreductase (nitroreductase family)
MSPSEHPGGSHVERARIPRVLPHWLIRSVGVVHLAGHRLTGGRLELSRPKPDRWGTMCLTTTGRRTGRERSAMLGYYEDGPNLVALAVNAWADAEPAWWLNLQADPDAVVELKDGSRPVHARAAEGEERARLRARWRDLGERSGEVLMSDIDAYAARLSREPAVVVLEPRRSSSDGHRAAADPGSRTLGEEATR